MDKETKELCRFYEKRIAGLEVGTGGSCGYSCDDNYKPYRRLKENKKILKNC